MPDRNDNKFISRRGALAMLLSATAASLLAACGPGAAPSAPTSAPAPPPAATAGAAKPAATTAAAPTGAAIVSTPAPQQAIKTGGTLRWGQVGDLVTIDAI